MNILVSAFACNPFDGSEPGVGWGIISNLARTNKIHVLTEGSNRSIFEHYFKDDVYQSITFLFISLNPRYQRLLSGFYLHWIYYFIWQLKAYRVAKKLVKREKIDLAWHVTYVCSWLPSWMGYLGIPFIWNAGNRDITPFRFLNTMTLAEKQKELLRSFIYFMSKNTVSLYNIDRSSLIFSNSPTSWSRNLNVVSFAIGGLSSSDLDKLSSLRHDKTNNKFRILSAGRLLGLKGFFLGVHAFSQLLKTFPNSEYLIVGDGPEMSRLKKLIQELGIQDSVKMISWLPRFELMNLYQSIDVLLHPSFHEQFGYVILEAMAAAKPVICLDVGGPSILVKTDYGFKVRVTNQQMIITDIVEALKLLAQNPLLRTKMGECARESAKKDWNWANVTNLLFENILKHYQINNNQ